MSPSAGPVHLLHRLLHALTFFTRLPVAHFAPDDVLSEPLDKSTLAFPIAGLVIGISIASVWLFACTVLPQTVAAVVAVSFGILFTGALHEDGLADCADGLGATNNAEKAMQIMRDSANGTYGTLALVVSFTLRVTALSALSPALGAAALIATHTHARAAIAIALLNTPYARKKGAASTVSQGISSSVFWQCMGLSVLICLLVFLIAGKVQLILAFLAGTFAAWMMLRYLVYRLGGYTGDGLGAMEQLCEIAMIISIAALV